MKFYLDDDAHPGVIMAMRFIDRIGAKKLQDWGNFFDHYASEEPVAERCKTNINGILSGEKIPDSEIAGLAWVLKAGFYDNDVTLSKK